MNICFYVDEKINWESNLLKETDDGSKAGINPELFGSRVFVLLNKSFEYS